MIKPRCDFRISEKCEIELRHFGAILFSPPKRKCEVTKSHICIHCYAQLKEIRMKLRHSG